MNSSGVISGTPSQGCFQGRFNFSVQVTDKNNLSYSKNMTLMILAPPVLAPYIAPSNATLDDCTVGMACTRSFSAWSGGAAPFSWNVTGLPAGMNFRSSATGPTSTYVFPGDLEIWGAAAAAGSYPIKLTVTDANGLTASQTYNLNVSPLVMDGADFLPNGTLNAAYSKVLRVLGGSNTGYTASISNGALPAGLTLNGMTVSGMPPKMADSTSVCLCRFGEQFVEGNKFLQHRAGLGAEPLHQLAVPTWVRTRSTYRWVIPSPCLPVAHRRLPGNWRRETVCRPDSVCPPADSITGTPAVAGTYTFRIEAHDSQQSGELRGESVYAGHHATESRRSFVTAFRQCGNSLQLLDRCQWGYRCVVVCPRQRRTASGLTLSSSGSITGTPTDPGQYQFTVTIKDSATTPNTLPLLFTVFVYPAGSAPPIILNASTTFSRTIGPTEIEIDGSGGNGTYVVTVDSGTLPPGMSLRQDFPSYFTSFAVTNLSGVALTPGAYNFTLKFVSGGAGRPLRRTPSRSRRCGSKIRSTCRTPSPTCPTTTN